MAKKFQKSPWSSAGPVYVAAAAFVGGILVFPATASGIFVAGLTSFCGWAISKMFWPKKLVDAIEDTTAKQQQQETQEVKQEEKKPDIDPDIKKRPRTGDKAIDALSPVLGRFLISGSILKNVPEPEIRLSMLYWTRKKRLYPR